MSSSLVITLAVVGGVAWLAFLGVSALRSRGKEEIAPNISGGRTDEELETRRLERTQLGAVIFAGFLAVSLPLYFLGEGARQEGFVEQFSEESVARGEHLVEEFACFSCHGPGVRAESPPTSRSAPESPPPGRFPPSMTSSTATRPRK